MGVAINSSRPPLLDHVIYAYFYSIVELKLLILSRAFKITVISRTGLKVDKLAGGLQVRFAGASSAKCYAGPCQNKSFLLYTLETVHQPNWS
jgi:hypothetical protein